MYPPALLIRIRPPKHGKLGLKVLVCATRCCTIGNIHTICFYPLDPSHASLLGPSAFRILHALSVILPFSIARTFFIWNPFVNVIDVSLQDNESLAILPISAEN